MTTPLLMLRNITCGACLTAAVIILLRLCLRRVLSPKAKYYLWLLLALRLCLPELPESPTSLMNDIAVPPQTASVTNIPASDPVFTDYLDAQNLLQ